MSVLITCNGLAKTQINKKIERATNESIKKLFINGYEYDNFTDIILPKLLLTFSCSGNSISSFVGMMLPESLTNFNCSDNKITSFNGLKLPKSLTNFDCSDNEITSFNGLKLPKSLTNFDCSDNEIMEIINFTFPPSLERLRLGLSVKLITPKFNSVLNFRLNNELEISDEDRIDLIFIYLNFDYEENEDKRQNYKFYDQILNKLVLT
jgi:hypothetical protein